MAKKALKVLALSALLFSAFGAFEITNGQEVVVKAQEKQYEQVDSYSEDQEKYDPHYIDCIKDALRTERFDAMFQDHVWDHPTNLQLNHPFCMYAPHTLWDVDCNQFGQTYPLLLDSWKGSA